MFPSLMTYTQLGKRNTNVENLQPDPHSTPPSFFSCLFNFSFPLPAGTTEGPTLVIRTAAM